MPLILDASVAVKLVVKEAGSVEALTLLDRSQERVAPDWMLLEVANALSNKYRYAHLSERQCRDALAALPMFLDRLLPSVDLLEEAVDLSFRLRHPVYDCLYLALAVRMDAIMVTADKPFVTASVHAELGSHVELLEW